MSAADRARAARILRRVGRVVPAAVLAVSAATVAVGLIIGLTTRTQLGTPLPPFLGRFSPAPHAWALVAVAVAVGLVAGAPWAIERVRSGAAFAGTAYLATVALGLAVNVARRGTGAWDHVFDLGPRGSWEAPREYLPALVDLRRGVSWYVRHFSDLLPGLPTHTKGNPPGPVVAMHLLGLGTAGSLAAACIATGALCTPLAYGLGRSLGDGTGTTAEHRGRVAAVLTAFSPSVVLFGVTSVDYVFAAFAAAVAWLLVARPVGARVTGCVAAGVIAFFSWVLLAIPVWAVLVELRRAGPRRAVGLAIGALVGVVGVTLVLAAVWGYDPVSILRMTRAIYGRGAAAHRPYAFWVFGSPAAWLALLGAPLAWWWLRAIGAGEASALALAAIVLISTLGGFTKAETERIWLPYVPLAAVGAAGAAGAAGAGTLPPRRLQLALCVMATEAIAIEILFGTVW